jgi:hypothetical protein
MKTKNLILGLALIILIIFVFAACADVTPIEACRNFKPYGFWAGLWHGMISPISFIFSLFNKDVAMYAVNNNGAWYNFGFVLGSGILFGGGSKATSK